MAVVLQKLYEQYNYYNYECSDPRFHDAVLIRHPILIIGIIATYLYFVKVLGPKFMQNRKPFQIDGIIKVYNLGQVLACAWLVKEGFAVEYWKPSWICMSVNWSTTDPVALRITRGCYVYFLLKICDMLDTIFFVLRKKQSQVTFLHVYHHAGMVALAWGCIKYYPGGSSVFPGHLNSFVHVLMYFYYFLTSVNKKYKNNFWWKKHLTQLQIIQFAVVSIQFTLILFKQWLAPDCNFPWCTFFLVVPQDLFVTILFYDFYRKNYIKRKEQ